MTEGYESLAGPLIDGGGTGQVGVDDVRANGDGRGAGESRGPATAVFRGELPRIGPDDWVGIAANRGAGQGKGRAKVDRLVREFRRVGLEPRVAWSLDERAALVAQAAGDAKARCMVAVGGDGTVAALANERPNVPISVLPCGTENLFANHFHLGRNPARLVAAVAAGRCVRLDLGRAQGRRFTLMAGIGFDADVVTRHHLARVGSSGFPRPTNRAAYVEPVLRSSFGYPFPPMTIRVTDPGAEETLNGATVFVFNLPRYALGLPFAPSARGDDGWLDLVVFRKPGAFHALHYLWLVVRGLHLRRPGVEHRKVKRVVVSSSERVPVQLDGDPGGFLEGAGFGGGFDIDIEPGGLDVLVPPAFG